MLVHRGICRPSQEKMECLALARDHRGNPSDLDAIFLAELLPVDGHLVLLIPPYARLGRADVADIRVPADRVVESFDVIDTSSRARLRADHQLQWDHASNLHDDLRDTWRRAGRKDSLLYDDFTIQRDDCEFCSSKSRFVGKT